MNGHPKPLGRELPPDREHEDKYPLATLEVTPTDVPMPAGTNWYSAFDAPSQGTDGKYRVDAKQLGSLRGGHCYCLEPAGEKDTDRSWQFYDQAREGACEGFGHARAITLMDDLLVDAFWLYDDARRIEGRYPDGEGATNRAAGKALVQWGAHSEAAEHKTVPPVIERTNWQEGLRGYQIASYHWAKDANEVRTVLGYDSSVNEIPLLNSWGKNGYPHRVFMPLELIQRLKDEDGEYSVLVR